MTTRLIRVLQVTPAFFPATYWGGPIYSVLGLCNGLAGLQGVELRVLTTDSAGPKLADRVDVIGFPMRLDAGYDVYYCPRIWGREISLGMIWHMWSMIRWADIVHLTGTYSFSTIPTLLACRLLHKPIVWSPRGALQVTHEWAGASRRNVKRVWEWACAMVMPEGCVLHVTSESERTASLARLPRATAELIPNGVDIPANLPSRKRTFNGTVRLMYIGRLDPKKGLENLLLAMEQIDDSDVCLDIFGAGDPVYVAKLMGLMRHLGIEGQVTFRGHVDGAAKRDAFLEADICVVPSYTENFAMVIAEALAHGVPVIASQGTPWAEVTDRNCGLWVKNDPTSLAVAITTLKKVDLEGMGKRGREWMEKSFGWNHVADTMYSLYVRLVNGHELAKRPTMM